MAKRRKKRSTHSRRRVSGMNKTDLMSIGLAVAGAVVAAKLTAKLKLSTNTTMSNLAPYAALVIGIGLPMVIKNPTAAKIALGLSIGGAIEALRKLAPGIVSGPYQLPVIGNMSNSLTRRRLMSGGAMSQNSVAGYSPARNSAYQDNMSVISGASANGMI